MSTSNFACIDFNININNIYEAPIISTTSFTVDENETSIGRVIASTDSGATLSFSIPGQNSNLTNTNNAFPQDDHSELDETDFYELSGDPSTQNISLKIWDIDDYLIVSLKDSAGVEQYTETFSSQGGEIDINNFLSEEGSTIDLELINTASGYTIYWELKVDDEVIYSNGCGITGVTGCANDSYSEGTVYQSTIYLGTASDDEIIIDEQTGDLEFNTAPDFETQDTYTVDVNVTDGTSTTSEIITINITDVNEAPVFDSLSYDYSVIEGNKDIGSISATDEDGDTVVYSVSLDYVADGSSLSGDIITVDSTGLLSFIDPANFENATSYTFDITASDGELSSTESVTVKLINKNGIVNTGEIYLCDFSVHIIVAIDLD